MYTRIRQKTEKKKSRPSVLLWVMRVRLLTPIECWHDYNGTKRRELTRLKCLYYLYEDS